MKSPGDLSIKLAKQWESSDHREQRLLQKNQWPVELAIGKPPASLLQKNPNTFREHLENWRNVAIGDIRWQEHKFQSAALPIKIPIHWLISSPSEWIKACKKSQIDKDYQWLSDVIPNIDPIFHKLIVRQSSIWKIAKETVIQCAELAMKLRPGIAEGKPIRSICINNIDTKFIEKNRNLLIKFLNIRYNNVISGNNLESFLDASDNNDHWVLLLPMDDNLLPFKQLRLTTSELETTNLPGTRLLIIENEQCRYQLPDTLAQTIVILGSGLDLKWLNNPTFKSKKIAYWGDIDSWGFRMLSMAKSALPGLTTLMMDKDTFLTFEDKAVTEPEITRSLARDVLAQKEINLFDDLVSKEKANRLEQEFIDSYYASQHITSWMINR